MAAAGQAPAIKARPARAPWFPTAATPVCAGREQGSAGRQGTRLVDRLTASLLTRLASAARGPTALRGGPRHCQAAATAHRRLERPALSLCWAVQYDQHAPPTPQGERPHSRLQPPSKRARHGGSHRMMISRAASRTAIQALKLREERCGEKHANVSLPPKWPLSSNLMMPHWAPAARLLLEAS